MIKANNGQGGLTDGWYELAGKKNRFLRQLSGVINWKKIEEKLGAAYPSKTGRPSQGVVLFKMLLIQTFYNLSDPQTEAQVSDRLSFREFCGLSLTESVPDETALVRFRQRLRSHGLEQELLGWINEQIAARGWIVKTATLIDASLIQSASRKDAEADYTRRKEKLHHGYNAHVAVDADHTLIRQVNLTPASVHDSQQFEAVLPAEQEVVFADKGYAKESRQQELAQRGIACAILHKAVRNRPLNLEQQQENALWSAVRCQIEKVFGHWKRVLGFRRVRYRGLGANTLEVHLKAIAWNLRRAVTLAQTT